MKREQLIESLAATLGESKAGSERLLSAVLDAIKDGLVKDGIVQITGFGTFRVRARNPRMGRNPRTGEPVQLAGSKTVGFKAGATLKDAVK
jgi:DNA-binding protein HU-beta